MPGIVHAAGTPAGTSIVNVATAAYTDTAGAQTVISNSVIIRVEEVLDVAVSPLGAQPLSVVPGAPDYRLVYRVTNVGNGLETFGLNAGTVIGGDDFDPALVRVAVDRDGDGVYNPLVDTDFAPGAEPALLPDTSVDVFVLVSLPAGASGGDDGSVSLTATALTGSGAPGTLFPGLGDAGSDAVAGNTRAAATATGGLLVAASLPTLVKAQDVGGGAPASGSIVTYTLTADLAGSTAASPIIVDPIPAGTSYVPGSLTLAGAALTDTADADAGRFTGSAVEVALATADGPQVVTFQIKVN
jgi:uncharacterized repeat protein (TIGR01451 family)